MKRRRITRTLPVAGGLLGAAFLPAAFAFAAGGYSFSPVDDPEVLGFFGMNPMDSQLVLTPPAISGSYQTYGDYTVAHNGTDLPGTVHADGSALSLAPWNFWDTNTYLITDSSAPGILPGSLFEIDKFDFLGLAFTTIYSDVIGPDGEHTYNLTTPFGSTHAPLDLSTFPPFQTDTPGETILDNGTAQYLNPDTLPGYLLNADHITGGPEGADYSDYYSFTANSPIQVEAITGALPTVFALQGFQDFDVTDADGNSIGSLMAAVTDTADFGANSSQAFLVTDSGDSGLPVGSLFMDFYIFGDNLVNHYSSIPGPDGHNVINDVLTTANGNIALPFLNIDLTKHVFDQFDFNAHGYDISSDGPQMIVGTNGLPPFDIAIQGYQDFAYTGPGDAAGSFTAAQTTTSDLIGDIFRSVLVTSTTSDDAPGVGSVFINWDFLNLNLFGITYADIVTDTGAHQIWDTFDIFGLNLSIPVPELFAIPQDMLDFFTPG